MPNDIEIYVNGCSTAEALAWATSIFGPFKQVEQIADGITLFHGSHRDWVVPLVITEGVEGGSFTSIYFGSAHTPWESDVACARDAWMAMKREVICDPGSLGPKPWQWYHINEEKEGVINDLPPDAST